MTEPIEDTQVWSAEDAGAIKRDVEEEDETGAPEKVAWPKKGDGHPLESAEELHEPRDESGEDVPSSQRATPDLAQRET